jgi:hypothetical protein
MRARNLLQPVSWSRQPGFRFMRIPFPFAALRLGALLAALALAACAQSTGEAQLAPAAAPPAPPPTAASPAPAEPLTTEKARGQCWMKFENDRKAKDLDTRARLVEQCVAERMSGRAK